MALTGAEKTKRYRERHPEKVKAAHRDYIKRNPDKKYLYDKNYREKNKEKVLEKQRRWVAANRERYRATCNEWAKRLRAEVIAAYGGSCACCGEHKIQFLALDHINGGGSKERKALGGQRAVYIKLKREGWPPGYQVLCHNCNMAKGLYGVCPHREVQ